MALITWRYFILNSRSSARQKGLPYWHFAERIWNSLDAHSDGNVCRGWRGWTNSGKSINVTVVVVGFVVVVNEVDLMFEEVMLLLLLLSSDVLLLLLLE
jgi:hypothetical protein